MSESTSPAQPGQSAVEEKKPTEPAKPDAPKKIELTEEELNARVAAALAADRKKAEDAAKSKKQAEESEAAKKQGEYQKLYEAEQASVKELKAQLELRDHTDAVREAVANAGKDNAGYDSSLFQTYVAERLLATLKPGTAKEDITKAAKAGVAQYVKDNPRTVTGTLPPKPGNTNQRQDSEKPNGSNSEIRQHFANRINSL